MVLVVPNSSEFIILQYITNNYTPENLVICLYANDITPNENSFADTFTEVTGGGYVLQNLTPEGWTISSGTPSSAEHTEIIWILAPETGVVYGYYVLRATSGELMWAERFPKGPFTINTHGDEIRVKPILTLE